MGARGHHAGNEGPTGQAPLKCTWLLSAGRGSLPATSLTPKIHPSKASKGWRMTLPLGPLWLRNLPGIDPLICKSRFEEGEDTSARPYPALPGPPAWRKLGRRHETFPLPQGWDSVFLTCTAPATQSQQRPQPGGRIARGLGHCRGLLGLPEGTTTDRVASTTNLHCLRVLDAVKSTVEVSARPRSL